MTKINDLRLDDKKVLIDITDNPSHSCMESDVTVIAAYHSQVYR